MPTESSDRRAPLGNRVRSTTVRGPLSWRTRRDDLRRARRRQTTAAGTRGPSQIVPPRRRASAPDSLPTEDRDQFTTDDGGGLITITKGRGLGRAPVVALDVRAALRSHLQHAAVDDPCLRAG